MLGSFTKSQEDLEAIERVRYWTRHRFRLAEHAVILVSEIRCPMPGCPPLETVVVFWTSEQLRYRFKLFKPVRAVAKDDLPISWLLPSLRDYGDLGCECC